MIDLESSIDQRAVLQERVLAIRRWMKDQYILYRDYCNMARAINTDYTPTTLEDAKEVGALSFQQIVYQSKISKQFQLYNYE